MGVPEHDQMTPQGVDAVAATSGSGSIRDVDHQSSKAHLFSSIGRQSSIYSLTLDEFQHALWESGKNFGSMNMDEFLSSIWTAEENQAINGGDHNNSGNNAVDHHSHGHGEVSTGKAIAKQHSLSRQGSLSLPAPLCRKTVDEVWSEIHKGQQGNQRRAEMENQVSNVNDPADCQPTYGEMTLEDFLAKAGVVHEQSTTPAPTQQLPQPQQQYRGFQGSNTGTGPSFVPRPMMGAGCLGGGQGGTYTMPQGGGVMGETSVCANRKRDGSFRPAPPPVCFAPRVGSGGAGGGNGYGTVQPMGMGGPVSPVSSDGIGPGSVDSMGLDMGGMRSRKRIMDGPVDKVVERRQRRMIKNRESAARSRARKQAYTVELEAELNQLKEENAHLKQTMVELERNRKQQYFEELRLKAQNKASRPRERLMMMQRNLSCPL